MTHLYAKYIQPEDVNGLPHAGAKLYFYDAGTTNLINVYQDYLSATPHANPVVADATGLFAPIWVGAAPYKTILKTSADVTVQTIDNIYPGNIPTSSTDNAIARFDGTAGALQDSAVTIADTTGNMTFPSAAVISFAGNVTLTHATGQLTSSGIFLATKLYAGDGAAGSPSIAFTSDGDTGFFRASSGVTDYVSNTVVRVEMGGGLGVGVSDPGAGNSAALTQFFCGDGAVGTPAFAYTADPDTGWYRVGNGTVGFSSNATLRATFAAGLLMTGATGGDKGAGTINAVGVYDDNVLLTCYPFEAYLDGTIDEEKWDAKVPDRFASDGKVEVRTHEGMHKFKARLGTDSDPLDLEKYIAHWKAKRHLTALPNEDKFDPEEGLSTGAWLQRLIETVEIQAIHISQLHDRLKAGGL